MKSLQEYKVTEETTLLAFLLKVLAPQSRTKIKSMLIQGRILVDGKQETKYDYILKLGAIITIGDKNISKQTPMPILYEDDWIIVVEKKSGILSVGNPTTKEENIYHLLRNYLKENSRKAELFVCHRLDQYTSGILLFAKNKDVQMTLRDSWNDYVKERNYIAVTETIPEPRRAEIRSYLVENAAMQVYSTRNSQQGKLAITRYTVVADNGKMAMLNIQILTGRKNQIRVHLSERGWFIAGDRKYGAKTDPIGRLMLHNNRFAIIHPVTNKLLQFELPIPNSFKNFFK